jgi:hypothetical protein
MKDASKAILTEIGNAQSRANAGGDAEQAVRFQVSTVAQAFVDLQQARHKADTTWQRRSSHSMRRWMSPRPVLHF